MSDSAIQISGQYIGELFLELVANGQQGRLSDLPAAIRLTVSQGLFAVMADLLRDADALSPGDIVCRDIVPDSVGAMFGELEPEPPDDEDDDPVFLDGGYAEIPIARMSLACRVDELGDRLMYFDLNSGARSGAVLRSLDMTPGRFFSDSDAAEAKALTEAVLAAYRGRRGEGGMVLHALLGMAHNIMVNEFRRDIATEMLQQLCHEHAAFIRQSVSADIRWHGKQHLLQIIEPMLREAELSQATVPSISSDVQLIAKNKVRL